MAKRKRSTKRIKQRCAKISTSRVVVWLLLLVVASLYLSMNTPQRWLEKSAESYNRAAVGEIFIDGRLELPAIEDSTLFYYNSEGRYSVNFSAEHKIPVWVAHILTCAEARYSEKVRSNSFRVDNHYQSLGYATATNNDYKKSGFDRGHLLPSADRDDDAVENRATFLFSNIAPQAPTMNRQTWNFLERQVREWAENLDTLYIVTGVVVGDSTESVKIGAAITVPSHFFKVIASKIDGKFNTIGFLVPNINDVDSNFENYAVTVDQVESITGLDFFHLLPDSVESAVEASFDFDIWN